MTHRPRGLTARKVNVCIKASRSGTNRSTQADVLNSLSAPQTQYSVITPSRAACLCLLAQSSLYINFLRFHVNEGSCSRLIAGCAQACTENQFPVISTEHVCCSLFRSNRGPTERKKSITEREGEEEPRPDTENKAKGIIDRRKEARDERIDKGREGK